MAQSILEEFRTALEADDVERAIELAPAVLDALEVRRKRMTAMKPAAQQLLTSTEDDSSQTVGQQFVTQEGEAEQKRLELALAILQLSEGGAEPTDVAGIVDDVIDKQASIDSLEGHLREDIVGIDLDPILVVTGPDQLEIPKGTDGSATFVIENVGGQSTDTVSIKAETDLSGVSVSPSSIESLGPNKEAEVDLVVPESDVDGQFMVNVVVRESADGAVGSLTLPVTIAHKKSYVDRAPPQLDEFDARVGRVKNQTRGNKSRAVEVAIRDIRRRLEALEEDLEGDEVTTEEADRRLEVIIKRLHSLRSILNGWREVSNTLRVSLQGDVTEIITTLERAKKAAL